MNPWHALFLGLVQGVSEFLPISSSAHLILIPWLFGWPDQGLSFDVACHLGTFAALAVYFARDLVKLVGDWLGSLRRGLGDPAGRLGWALGLGTIPVAVVGLLAHHWVEREARNPLLIAGTSLFYGALMAWADRSAREERATADVTVSDGWWIGAAQALAVIPGTSRSGITITAGLWRRFERSAAARFSFLLAVPASVLVAAKHLWDLAGGKIPSAEYGGMAIGFVTSGVAGYLVIDWLLGWLRRRRLFGFAIYRVLIGLAILLWWWLRGPAA